MIKSVVIYEMLLCAGLLLWLPSTFGSNFDDSSNGDRNFVLPALYFAGALINVIPSNIEYKRHKKAETSYTWIYLGGYAGGMIGASFWVGMYFISGSTYYVNSATLFASSLTGMVAGNRLGHSTYYKYKKNKLSLTPLVSYSNINLSLSYNY